MNNLDLNKQFKVEHLFENKTSIFDYQNKSAPIQPEIFCDSKYIALPTNTGCRFVVKSEIVLFKYTKATKLEKEKWEAILKTEEKLRLKTATTAKEILKKLDKNIFLQTGQDTILNLDYLSSIEFKSHRCILHKPFNDMDIKISRANLILLKERF